LPEWRAGEGPADAWEIVYVDHFGNLFSGVRAGSLNSSALPRLELNGHPLSWAKTYSEVPLGTALCYINSIGLLEIGVNQGHAASLLQAGIGSPLSLLV
jgi:S-adenosylmethionine hydrolase